MAPGSRGRPSWQADGCPPWCVSEHREDDHPDDRFHDSAPALVPSVLGPDGVAADLLVVTSRRCDTANDWVFVGHPERAAEGLVLSRESARRLARAILAQLDP